MGLTQQFFVFFAPGDLDLWPLTYELRQDFCTVYLTAKFDCPTFSRSKVIMRTNILTNKQYTGRNSHEPSSRYASVIFRQVLSVSDPNSTASNHHITKLLMTVHTSTVSWSECRPVHRWPYSLLHLLRWRQWSFLITLHWGVDDAKYTPVTRACLSGLLDNSRIHQLADWTTRGLDISRTGQLAD